jgi:hypothetical protein
MPFLPPPRPSRYGRPPRRLHLAVAAFILGVCPLLGWAQAPWQFTSCVAAIGLVNALLGCRPEAVR